MMHPAMAKQPPTQRRTANIALHVKLTDEEASQMRALAEARGSMRAVVVAGMEALEEQGALLRRMQEAESKASRLAQESGASETWRAACSSILEILKTQARTRPLTETELDIWTLAMGETLLPPAKKPR